MSAVSRSPELEELLTLAINSFLEDVHTGLPGRVDEYFPETQKANIKPLIKRRIIHEDGSELLEELPVIPDVPIAFDRTGKFFITFPVAKGDLVRLHFLERSIDNYLSGIGDDTDPDEFRRHDLSDAIAVPGLYPFRRSIKDINSVNLVMGHDEGGIQIHLTPNGTMEVKVTGESEEAVALGNALQSFWNNSFKPTFDAHIHPTGVGPSGPPASPAPAFDAKIISKVLLVKGP